LPVALAYDPSGGATLKANITHVDAFAERAFSGNPAAVCVLNEDRDAAWMQLVAREMNLSETAFLRPRGDGAFALRWFTPNVEVDLCGHATLASAHVLWEENLLPAAAPARFDTRSGRLTAELSDGLIWLDFPATPETPAAVPDGLEAALGVRALYVGRSRFDFLVEVESPEAVLGLRPDFRRLADIESRGVIVTSRAAPADDEDFVSRFFAPAAGVDEDPVTGSTHCCLGPFWEKRLAKSELAGRQLSRRGGVVRVRCVGDRVRLGGRAVTILRGELRD
jgi:PhzF family phenazine biosynthesis protein